MELLEDIPAPLTAPANAAVAWINDQRGAHFRLTGLVDPDAALAAKPGDAVELGLVLCEGDVCLREQVLVTPRGDRFEVAAIEAEDSGIPPLLDPPPGVRSTWLDDQLAKYDFILLLFYRGRW